jgi:hypothetical protein
MQLLISDANILIDMEDGGLLTLMFKLPYVFRVPDILFAEELEEGHRYMLALGLQLGELTSDSMIYAQGLCARYANPSRNDCFSLALARQENCPLLTGDRALRVAAEREAILVMGTLWLVDQLVIHQVITVAAARNAYAEMRRKGSRLPWDEAERRLREQEDAAP